MIDPTLLMLSKILMIPVKELIYPRIIFSLLLPAGANLVMFYKLQKKMRIFGRGKMNNTISIVLAVFFSYFAVKLGLLGYAVACLGISFLYFKKDYVRLGFIFGMIGLWFGLQWFI